MGSKISKINVLVLGLANVGKTHFIDFVELQENTTKSPTFGYHEGLIKYDSKTEIRLIEYGFSISWDNIQHDYSIIYIIIRASFTLEKVLETKSILLNMHSKAPTIPICIIYTGEINQLKKQKFQQLLGLEILRQYTQIAQISLNFDTDKKKWMEKISRLLEWTCAHGKAVQTK